MTFRFPFDNSYARLPQGFHLSALPTPVPQPRLIKLNRELAAQLGLDPDFLASPQGTETLAGNRIAEGSQPLAMAYAGHQFGQFVPQLGDGRAILLGEVVDAGGVRRDIQLKGSGPTPFSRRGDGRAALGPVLREYVVSEAMAALGVPTTRALAVVTTGDLVMRETPLPGAILTRVASSHIRIGTFQFFAARQDLDGVRQLADHVIARHYPDAADAAQPYLTLLQQVIARQAALVAQWLSIGFIHGVMNTDNMSVSGETIDYGPCAFMDAYHPATVFSSIDRQGRYSYANQPGIAQWNLTRLAECLLPLLDEDQDAALKLAQEAIAGFAPAFHRAYLDALRRKLGLSTAQDDDADLAEGLLNLMANNEADFTLTFRHLCDAAGGPEFDTGVRGQFTDPAAYDGWAMQWRERMAAEEIDAATRQEVMRTVNPAFIPRNHQVEAVIRAAVDHDDFGPFEKLNAVLARPYADQPEHASYALPPLPEQRVTQTFCGT
jgi:uncharacterized protein YdiU (UPF0061 family)